MLTRNKTLPEVRLTDSLIEAIGSELAAFEPERGGALLGFGGTAHLLVEDDFGTYGQAFWDISREVSGAVGALEERGFGQFIGTVHTHPSGVLDPSGQDELTMTRALELNPHLSELLVCVVTKGTPRVSDATIPGGHRMSVHVIRRDSAGRVEFLRAQPVIVPIADLLTAAALPVPGPVSVSEVRQGKLDRLAPVLRVDGEERLVIGVTGSDDAWFVSPFPTAKPLLVELVDGTPRLVPIDWDGAPTAQQMLRATTARFASAIEEQATQSPTDRVVELIGSMAGRHVLVAGAGSVGSRIAEDLARSGVEHFTIIDPDVVALPNMARSVYVRSDIGTPKVSALASRLRAINPAAEVSSVQSTLLKADLVGLLDGIDLAVLATDDMAEQAQLAGVAYRMGVMHVACALYRKAAAGEVVMVLPEAATPCWACAVGTSALSASERPDTNYGVDGRLVAESGLGSSINLVSSVASLLAVGLLAGPDSAAGASLGRLVAESRTMGIVTTTPKWSMFADVFETMAHQSYPQSIWPRLGSNAECPLCAPSTPDDVLTGEPVAFHDLMPGSAQTSGPQVLGADGPPTERVIHVG